MNYLGNALRQQKLKQAKLHQHLLELFSSFMLGMFLGLCFGAESFIKWLN